MTLSLAVTCAYSLSRVPQPPTSRHLVVYRSLAPVSAASAGNLRSKDLAVFRCRQSRAYTLRVHATRRRPPRSARNSNANTALQSTSPRCVPDVELLSWGTEYGLRSRPVRIVTGVKPNVDMFSDSVLSDADFRRTRYAVPVALEPGRAVR